ncbi:MAG: hypothetical protein COX91_02505 [Candidatus Nealsonbacteria bacterium CG_4_10_14_0_2_um_filter_39_15]|uniref:Amino acid transporter transmembrane domain-containing protein n=1 Tax=Candidatus Nealsonbacteria bacterium CG_4_10_14_0_2_um_filter_39_15 TaxID=1974681 RepID=A0A2M7UVV9_9BACT|nr:MAG: hypothetical protein COX91_02505 [Candidatus Nealsonbacteria bacterium CG_4_10_14_0_2_um_filter_39_15]
MNKNFLFALSVLLGTIVGAGIFGIPYVISKSGMIPGFFYFLILGGAVLLIHLFFGEIILRTKGEHRLVGLAQRYLGRWGKTLITISVLIGTTGALLAYLILAGDFLKILFSPSFNLSAFHFTLFFWAILTYFIFRGIKLIAPAELLTNLLFFLVIFIIFGFCLPKFSPSNLVAFSLPNAFLPYGVILFSLVGWSAIPEIEGIFRGPGEKRKIKTVIIWATAIVITLYLAFALIVVGVAGNRTSFDTLSGLTPFLGSKIVFFGALAGLITIADSFLVLSLYLRNTFIYDFKFSKTLAFLAACSLPLLLFLAGFRSFIGTIGFVGTVVGVLEGAAIILIFKRAKALGDRAPEYSLKMPSILLYFLMLILILGAMSQVF